MISDTPRPRVGTKLGEDLGSEHFRKGRAGAAKRRRTARGRQRAHVADRASKMRQAWIGGRQLRGFAMVVR